MAIKVSGTTVIDDSRNLQNTVNVNATGNAYANTFIGDGSQLTNLPAGGSSTKLVASGTLADGSTVVVNADGTVSTTGFGSASTGSAVTFESGNAYYISSSYDSTNGKIVIAYQDLGNSSYGTAVVGTVSGTSISFGTPVVFSSASSDYERVACNNSGQCLIVYRRSGGKAIVGTVSGNSISFGSEVGFDDYAQEPIVAYDSGNDKFVVGWQDTNDSFHGNCAVATVSGTSVSFGTHATFGANNSTRYLDVVYDSTNERIVFVYADSANSDRGFANVGVVSGDSITFDNTYGTMFSNSVTVYNTVRATFDSVAGKVVIGYTDTVGSRQSNVVVGTVSGSSISFGTPVLLDNNSNGQVALAFIPAAGKTLVVFNDEGSSGYGKFAIGTISGTAITFDTAVVFREVAVSTFLDVTYDPNAKAAVISHNYGDAIVHQPSVTNLTSENFIGISSGAYANGATATVQLVGATDDAQSGLTTGSLHYVLANGSISTTAGSPSVVAGLALSSTTLAIKAQ